MNLDFFVRMKDFMSSGLVKLAATAQSSFTKVQNQVNKVTGRNKLLSSSFSEIERNIQRVEQAISTSRIPSQIRAARQELEKLQRMANGHSGNTNRPGGGGLAGMARQFLPALGVAGIMALGGSALSNGLEAQARSKSFEVMAGKEAGGKLNNNLTKYAQDSIYGNEVFQNAQTMMGFGIDAKDVMPSMKMIGDIAMGDANKMSSLTLAFSQVKAAGKLTGQDLLQFVNAGFNPLQVMAEKTGASIGDLRKAVSDGAVSFEMVEAAFKTATGAGGKFHNMTEEIAKTDFGKMKAFEGQLEGLSVKVGGMLAPALGNLISNYLVPLVNWLSAAATWIQENWNWIGLLVTMITAAAAAYSLLALYTNALAAAQWLWNIALSMNPIGLVIAGIAALVAGVLYAWNTFEGFRMVIYGLWGAFKQVFENIGGMFKAIFQPIFDAIQAIKDGDYAKAGIAVAEIGANMATLGAYGGSKYVAEGGLTKGVADAYTNGAKEGLNKAASVGTTNKDSGTPSTAAPSDAFNALKGYKGGSDDSAAKGVTSAGPRVININGVKFAETINIKSDNLPQAVDEIEKKFEEMFLRVLNSGAQLQD